MDDREVHIRAFMVDTWLKINKSKITQKSEKIIERVSKKGI